MIVKQFYYMCRSYARNLFLAGIPTEVIWQNPGHVDVKTTQEYIGVLDGSTRAPVSVYDASSVLVKLKTGTILSQESL